MPGGPIRDMHGDDLDAAQIDADLHFALHIKHAFGELRVEYPERLGDRDAYVISCSNVGQAIVKLYFDEQSGLLVRLVRYAQSPLGVVPTRIDYGDYRDTAGVEIPFRWTVAQPGENSTIQLEQMKVNVPIDDALFAKPISPAAGENPLGP
jgi:photosynthetic reaction center cytochrome c subunit